MGLEGIIASAAAGCAFLTLFTLSSEIEEERR
jgi:hypothetical protein